MKAQTVSTANIGIFCVLFCMMAGFIYGGFEVAQYPANAFGKGLLAFGGSLFWSALIYSFIRHKRNEKFGSLILLSAYVLNVCLFIFVLQNCQNTCNLHAVKLFY